MRNLLRHVGSATAGTLVGNALSLALPFVITAWFQAGRGTDAYFYSLGAILFLNVAISVAVESSTTPHIVNMLGGRPEVIKAFVRRTQLQAVAVCALLSIVGVALFLYVLLPGTSFDSAQQVEARTTLLILAPLPALVTWNAVLAGACYACKSFGTPTATVSIRTICALIFGWVFRSELGLEAVALGLIVGELVRILVLEIFFGRVLPAVSAQARISTTGGEVGVTGIGFWKTAAPQVASMSMSGISPLVDKTVAVAVGAGAVTTLELTQRLVYTPILLMLSGLGLVLGTRWATRIAAQEWSFLAGEYRRVQKAVLIASLGFLVLAVPAAFLLRPLTQAWLSIDDPTLFAWTFVAAAVGIPFALASQMSVRLLLAARATRVMPYLTVCAVVLNLLLDLALVRLLGLPGIALASAFVNIFNALAYALVVQRLLTRRSRLHTPAPPQTSSTKADARSTDTGPLGPMSSRATGLSRSPEGV